MAVEFAVGGERFRVNPRPEPSLLLILEDVQGDDIAAALSAPRRFLAAVIDDRDLSRFQQAAAAVDPVDLMDIASDVVDRAFLRASTLRKMRRATKAAR